MKSLAAEAEEQMTWWRHLTPKMIDAGVGALVRYDPEFEDREEAVERIFRAMLEAES